MNRPWYAAVNNDTTPKSQDPAYEVIGPQVFRFEYWYLLKNGNLTDVPWDTDARPTQTTIDTPSGIGLTDVQAIAVAIAVIDPTSRALSRATSTHRPFRSRFRPGRLQDGTGKRRWRSKKGWRSRVSLEHSAGNMSRRRVKPALLQSPTSCGVGDSSLLPLLRLADSIICA